jgi:acyl-CoA oxidase
MSPQTTSSPLAASIRDERLRPFLPLVYAAWADGELTTNEIAGICTTIALYPGIDVDCQVALRHWLDPDRPPTPDELELLRRHIADWVALLDTPPTASATDLGIAIAETTRTDLALTEAERSAVADVEARLGPLGPPPGVLGSSSRLRDIVEPVTSFDVTELAGVLDGRHAVIRRRLRQILATPEFAYPDQPGRDEHRELVLRWTSALADEGLGTLGYPAPYGADDRGSAVAAFAMLGHHDLSLMTKFGVQFGLFGGAIAQLGTADHHAAYLADIGALTLPGCFAMTETGHGSNVRDLETRAVYDGATDELVVSTPNDLAAKDYIGNAAAHGRLAVVFARLLVDDVDHGVNAVLVPIRDETGAVLPGIRIEDDGAKGGLNGVDNGRIWFNEVRVPRAALLDRFATIDDDGVYLSDIPDPDRRFFTMIGTLVGGRIGVGAAAVNVAKSALTIALRYAHRRRQFGPTAEAESLLIDYPIHQQRLIPRLAATYAYHFAYEALIGDFADGTDDPRRLEARAAGLKAFATWHAVDTIQAAREACGGQGYLAENRLTAMRADGDILTTYEGDNTVLSQLVAKGLLSEFRQQFESMSSVGTVRYLFRRTGAAITESTGVAISTTDAKQLVDAGWQIEQLRWREDHLVESLALRIKKRIDDGVAPYDAFTQVQTHAVAAAAGHVERMVLEAFADAVAPIEDGPVRDTLERLRGLHGLATIRARLGWFQEHGRLSAGSAKAVRRAHDRLVSEIAAESLALVDAFAIPDEILAAPIAISNPNGTMQ